MIDLLQRNAMRLVLAGMAVTFGIVVVGLFLELPAYVERLDLIGLVLIVVGLWMLFFAPGGDLHGDPVVVASPVTGRWLAMNSPASKVPSHGVRAYGQAFAIDLVHEPLDGTTRPSFGSGSGMSAPADYPAFGRPVHAMIDGTVVRAHDRQRDHRTRTRFWSVGVMMLEGVLRELRGSDGVVGNHVVIDRGDGVFALVAHLRKGSATVRPGDRVVAGDVIGSCGNSGNTTEPHVHAQLMDRARPSAARGLPMAFRDVVIDGEPVTGLPANASHLVG
ncbi:metalloendopeptidase [Nocardioides sp. Soil797]|nr:metalloendopeptidase [Nocardioides sp. Soil797]